MLPQEVIRRKRDGEILEPDEIAGFIAGIGDGSIGEAQIAAFAMTVRLNGMTPVETVAMTLAMRDSGTVLSWPGADRPVADKHSTGGVGDNVSLMLAPIAAACGLTVPMISGRGLGHTGGTLDKLQSIPGYDITPDAETLRRCVERRVLPSSGRPARSRLRPPPLCRQGHHRHGRQRAADHRLHPVQEARCRARLPRARCQARQWRLHGGAGEAETLAGSLVDVGNGAGLPTRARLTDMSEPLADSVGNAREVEHALAFLRGEKAGTRIETVVLALAADMLLASGRATSWQAGHERARSVLASGEALDRLGRMIHALGGPADFVEHPDRYLAPAPERLPVVAARSGYIAGYRTRDIGLLLIEMGGGRLRAEDGIDHRVGLTHLRPVGTRVEAGDLLATLHAASPLGAEQAAAVLAGHIHIAEEAPATRPVLVSEIT